MKVRNLLLFVLLIVFSCGALFAQGGNNKGKKKTAYKNASDHILYDEYELAIPYLKELLQVEPENAYYNFWMGKSLYNTYKKSQSLGFLEVTNEINADVDREFHYYFAHALHYNLDFEHAIEEYKKDIENYRMNSDRFNYTKNRIAQCMYGKVMMKNLNRDWKRVKIKNSGKNINTEFAEHSPVISANDSILIFTGRKPESLGAFKEDHYYDEDVYMSKKMGDQWSKAVNIGKPVNSKGHDATISLTADGKTLFIYRHKNDGGLYVTEFDTLGKKWKEPKKLEKPLNSKYYEACVFLAPDGNQMFFSSDRPGGYGGRDIYVAKKLANGEWAEPVNMGPRINTPFDEDAPFVHPDGVRFYFSSNGPNSMGGFDIFVSEFDKSTGDWLEPLNMSYPVNTADDDIYFVLNMDGEIGYYSSGKEGGYGEKDIYQIEFPYYPYPRRFHIVVLEGIVLDEKTLDTLNAKIEIIDKSTGQSLNAGVAWNNPRKFHYELDSESEYMIRAYAEGYPEEYTETFRAPELIDRDIYIDKIVRLAKPLLKTLPELQHVYFNFDKDGIREESIEDLEAVVEVMLENQELQLEVRGHTDWFNTVDYNQDLSNNRATSALDYLIRSGVSKERISSKGLSENRPIRTNEDDEGRQYNRRSEFHFILEDELVFQSVRLRRGVEGITIDHEPPKGEPGFDQPENVIILSGGESQPATYYSERASNDNIAVPRGTKKQMIELIPTYLQTHKMKALN